MNAGIAASCAPTRFIGLARYASIFSRYKHLTTKLKCRPTWCYRCLSFRERYHALHAFNARSNGDRQLARIKYFQTIVQRCFTRAVRDFPVALIELIWKWIEWLGTTIRFESVGVYTVFQTHCFSKHFVPANTRVYFAEQNLLCAVSKPWHDLYVPSLIRTSQEENRNIRVNHRFVPSRVNFGIFHKVYETWNLHSKLVHSFAETRSQRTIRLSRCQCLRQTRKCRYSLQTHSSLELENYLTLWLPRWSNVTCHGFSCDATVAIGDRSVWTSYNCNNWMKIDS